MLQMKRLVQALQAQQQLLQDTVHDNEEATITTIATIKQSSIDFWDDVPTKETVDSLHAATNALFERVAALETKVAAQASQIIVLSGTVADLVTDNVTDSEYAALLTSHTNLSTYVNTKFTDVINTTYTKTQVDTKLLTVYTKTEIDSKIVLVDADVNAQDSDGTGRFVKLTVDGYTVNLPSMNYISTNMLKLKDFNNGRATLFTAGTNYDTVSIAHIPIATLITDPSILDAKIAAMDASITQLNQTVITMDSEDSSSTNVATGSARAEFIKLRIDGVEMITYTVAGLNTLIDTKMSTALAYSKTEVDSLITLVDNEDTIASWDTTNRFVRVKIDGVAFTLPTLEYLSANMLKFKPVTSTTGRLYTSGTNFDAVDNIEVNITQVVTDITAVTSVTKAYVDAADNALLSAINVKPNLVWDAGAYSMSVVDNTGKKLFVSGKPYPGGATNFASGASSAGAGTPGFAFNAPNVTTIYG